MTRHLSAAEWVGQARPESPPALVARVREVLDAHPAWGKLAVVDALLEAADALLKEVLKDGEAGRDRALDLLAADACVTWAFEVAAEDPDSLGEQARATMQRLGKVIV